MNDIEHESLCKRCGKCCTVPSHGACMHLGKDPDGKCFCHIYKYRHGYKLTMDGARFRCGTVAEMKWLGVLPEGCGYKDK